MAVITGAGSGIGRGMTLALAAEGAHVVVADIEPDAAEAVAGEVRSTGRRAIAVRTDVTDEASVEARAARAYDEFGAMHVLCNNAGVYIGGQVLETPLNEWAWLIAVNLMGVVHGLRAFLPRMIAQAGEAHVVNTGSISGLYPTPNQGAYSASKYAVVGLSERLRVELEPRGIGVSVLCPGGVRTRISESRRNRHERFGGAVAAQPRPANAPARTDNVLEPIDVGRLVVQGIKDNRLYIHTHAEWKQRYEERFGHILADCEVLNR